MARTTFGQSTDGEHSGFLNEAHENAIVSSSVSRSNSVGTYVALSFFINSMCRSASLSLVSGLSFASQNDVGTQ